MNILETPRAKRYFEKHPIVEMYNGYEIRKGAFDNVYIVDAAIAIYGVSANHIEDCREFIDKLVKENIKQYDDEAVMKYVIRNRKY